MDFDNCNLFASLRTMSVSTNNVSIFSLVDMSKILDHFVKDPVLKTTFI